MFAYQLCCCLWTLRFIIHHEKVKTLPRFSIYSMNVNNFICFLAVTELKIKFKLWKLPQKCVCTKIMTKVISCGTLHLKISESFIIFSHDCFYTIFFFHGTDSFDFPLQIFISKIILHVLKSNWCIIKNWRRSTKSGCWQISWRRESCLTEHIERACYRRMKSACKI